MKKTILALMIFAGVLFGAQSAHAGITIGSDLFFTTSLYYNASNAMNTTGDDTWQGRDSFLYLSLLPKLSGTGISGDAKIYVNSSNYNNIYFGGAVVEGATDDETFKATIFALDPALAMSDPMGSGARYGKKAETAVISAPTRFADGTVYYPSQYDSEWVNAEELNLALGGERSTGLITEFSILDGLLKMEDFINYNLNNFDTYGVNIFLNELDIAMLNISAGFVYDKLAYKEAQDFGEYNGYYLFDSISRLPMQHNSLEGFSGVGGYFDVGVLDMFNVFAEFKSTKSIGHLSDTNYVGQNMGGYSLYAGAYSIMDDWFAAELDLAMGDESFYTNDDSSSLTGDRSNMEIKGKFYTWLDFDMFGMYLKTLVEATYMNATDNLSYFGSYENVTLPFADLSDVNGLELKASFDFDFFYMFSIREVLRYASADFADGASTNTYGIATFESRTYLDIDLEDVMTGLWVTAGIRLKSHNITSSSTTTDTGDVFYALPYAEICYKFGKDAASFARLTYGIAEFHGDLAEAYGLGYDNFVAENSAYGTDSGSLYNVADGLTKNNHRVSLEVGVQL